MPRQNVELLRHVVDAYNARDIEAFISHCDPGVELLAPFATLGGAAYHGHDGLRSWHRDVDEAWGQEIRVEPEAFFDLGDEVLIFYVLHARGKHSGVPVAMPLAVVSRWREGRIVYLRAYAHREDALSDVGVAEDALEPIAP
jgi:ketosteroid isomerase-like protein